jgi:uncharacterized protein involved in type VI secretion and phage assembly
MARQIFFEILVDGELTVSPFSNFTLIQRVNEHHEFTLTFSHDVKGGDDILPINKYHAYLGKSITVTFGDDLYMNKKGGQTSIFSGIITEVCMADNPFDNDVIVLKGKSPSILLETVESCSSFVEKNLDQIVKHFSQGVDTNILSVESNAAFKKAIPFVFQYMESNFNFLKRLSADYGEWLYYDGRKLQFGKPSKLPPDVKLIYPVDVTDVKLSMRISPSKFKRNSYSLKTKSDKFEADASNVTPPGLGNYGGITIKSSDKVFASESVSPSIYRSGSQAELDEFGKIKRGTIASDLVVLSARSDNANVHVGTIVELTKIGNNSDGSSATVGKYFVIQAIHSVDGNGNYSNSFEGIPSEIQYLPAPTFIRPDMKPQVGVVLNNKDPQGQGKIKVQLMLQAGAGKFETPWIPYMTPSGGAGGRGKNRGMHFIPEVDDYVMVGFTDNDPSRPFAMGSVPLAEDIDSKPNNDNFEKVISTRSGNTIFFRDKDNANEQEIRVETDEANVISILLKGSDGTILIKSSKEINVESTKTVNVKSEKITIEGKDIAINASSGIDMKANQKVKIAAAQIEISASSELKAKGTNVKVEGSAMTEVKGTAKLSLTASGQTELKGAIVMIN